MSKQNIEKEDKRIVKIVMITVSSIFLGSVLLGVLIISPLILETKYHDGSGRKHKAFLSQEAMAAEVLQEKYGEEFIIHKVFPKASHEFFAECSSVSNEEVVFEAAIWKDGSGVVYDDYISSSVAKELEKELEDELKKYYGSVFVQVYPLRGGGRYGEVDSMKDMTLEEYVKRFNPGWCRIDIGIDAKEGNEHLEEEYAFYESMQKKISDKKIPPMDVYYYNMDAELQEWCNDFFTQYAEAYGTYTDKKFKCNKMTYSCTTEGINITYDEFKTMREELGKDE